MKEKIISKRESKKLEEIKAFNKKLKKVSNSIHDYKQFLDIVIDSRKLSPKIIPADIGVELLQGTPIIENIILMSFDEALKSIQDFEKFLKICVEFDRNTDHMMQITGKLIEKHSKRFNACPMLEKIIDEMLNPSYLKRIKRPDYFAFEFPFERIFISLQNIFKEEGKLDYCNKIWDLNQNSKWFDSDIVRFSHLDLMYVENDDEIKKWKYVIKMINGLRIQ